MTGKLGTISSNSKNKGGKKISCTCRIKIKKLRYLLFCVIHYK